VSDATLGLAGRDMDPALASLRRRRYCVARRAQVAGAMVLLLPSVAGCYQYVPITDRAPVPGAEVSLGVTDQGRVALTGQVGPGARRLRGRLTHASDSLFVISLTSVEYVGTPIAARWSGEAISVSRNFVSNLEERRLSRTRSWLTAGAFAALAVAVSTIAIVGFGSDGGSTRPGDGGPGEQ
jgi:hypothetical protein